MIAVEGRICGASGVLRVEASQIAVLAHKVNGFIVNTSIYLLGRK